MTSSSVLEDVLTGSMMSVNSHGRFQASSARPNSSGNDKPLTKVLPYPDVVPYPKSQDTLSGAGGEPLGEAGLDHRVHL